MKIRNSNVPGVGRQIYFLKPLAGPIPIQLTYQESISNG
jgi:hypothetical protein